MGTCRLNQSVHCGMEQAIPLLESQQAHFKQEDIHRFLACLQVGPRVGLHNQAKNLPGLDHCHKQVRRERHIHYPSFSMCRQLKRRSYQAHQRVGSP